MKKIGVLCSFLFSINYVSAASFEEGGNQLIEWIKQIFTPFFQAILGTNEVDQYFFARVLLLLLIYVIVFISLKSVDLFKNNKGVTILVSAIVAILGIRYLPTDSIISWIIIPYGAFATAIAVLLPVLIYTFFVHSSMNGTLGRRFAWIIFALVFVGLWISRLYEVTNGLKNFAEFSVMNWIYICGIVAVGIMFIFDNEVHKYFGRMKINKDISKSNTAAIANLHAERERLATSGSTSEHVKKRIEEIDKRLREIG